MAASPTQMAAEIARDCMASRVRRLERVLTRIYDDAIRAQGLTGSQLEILVAAQLSGKTTAAAVGRILDLEKSTVSRNLARLAAAGLVDVSDGLQITARGAAAIAACHPAWREAQRKARAQLHPSEGRLVARLRGHLPPPRRTPDKGMPP
jgi:DNA-binding MarR family transcriptional regulator